MTCPHDHGDGFIRRELRHIKDHWLSCIITCLIVHGALDGINYIVSVLGVFL